MRSSSSTSSREPLPAAGDLRPHGRALAARRARLGAGRRVGCRHPRRTRGDPVAGALQVIVRDQIADAARRSAPSGWAVRSAEPGLRRRRDCPEIARGSRAVQRACAGLAGAMPARCRGGRRGASRCRSRRSASAPIAALDSGVLAGVNAFRVPARPRPLISTAPHAKPRRHSREMGADGYFAHASFDGTTYWKRIERWYPSGDGLWSVGENLLWSSPGVSSGRSAQDVDALARASREHPQPELARDRDRRRPQRRRARHLRRPPVTIITTDFGVRHYGSRRATLEARARSSVDRATAF